MIEGKKIMALICARGGSKGVPGKNIRSLGGRPLIAWSIDRAKSCPLIDKVVVSTDSPDIARVAEEYEALVPFMRPHELAEDKSPEWPVWQHALKEMEVNEGFVPDYLIVLPPTSPFRSEEDIRKGIQRLHTSQADIVISVLNSGRNPYFNMVEINHDGLANLCKRPTHPVMRRQDAPPVFDMTTVIYAADREYVHNANGTFEGKVMVITIPEARATDIDTELDFKFAEFLIAEGVVPAYEKNQ